MTPTPPCAGPDVHRRTVLAGLGLAGGVGALDVLVGGNRVRAATTGGDGNVLVTVFLRGGMDGLSTVVPHGDPGYAAARPTIAVPRTSLLHANATFGLAPAMAALSPLWSAGQVAAVHATGLVTANRSHFEAQALVEEAGLRSYRSGWVNRLTEVLTRPSVTLWRRALSTRGCSSRAGSSHSRVASSAPSSVTCSRSPWRRRCSAR